MISLHEAIRARVLLADGAMGTQLQRAGLPLGECGDRWTLEQPDRVEAIHRAYADSGCDLLITNSFGANIWSLERYGLADRVGAVNRTSAELARRAAAPGTWVLGDVGPSGQLLEPLGSLAASSLRSEMQRQAAALLEGGADAIIIETMMAIEEAEAAVAAARAESAPLVIASMAYDRMPNGTFRTTMGVSPQEAAARLVAAGAHVVGANCGTRLSVGDFALIARQLREAVDVPLIVQPNAGQPRLEGDRVIYDLSPAEFAAQMEGALDEGVAAVGGCCGTTPDHIRALREALDRRQGRAVRTDRG